MRRVSLSHAGNRDQAMCTTNYACVHCRYKLPYACVHCRYTALCLRAGSAASQTFALSASVTASHRSSVRPSKEGLSVSVTALPCLARAKEDTGLYLAAVEVDGEEAVDACRLQHDGHVRRRNWHSRRQLPILKATQNEQHACLVPVEIQVSHG